jgi:hypothetical protein
VSRCPRDGYALIRGRCPICHGKHGTDRMPMLAPLPAAPDHTPKPVRYWSPKRRKSE